MTQLATAVHRLLSLVGFLAAVALGCAACKDPSATHVAPSAAGNGGLETSAAGAHAGGSGSGGSGQLAAGGRATAGAAAVSGRPSSAGASIGASAGSAGNAGDGGSTGSSAAGSNAAGAAAGAGGAAGAPVALPPAPADVSAWDKAGAFAAMTQASTGPNGAYTIWRPTELGKGGAKHPIVLWGSGVGQAPSGYAALLTHWATHGMVVISPTGTNPGSGVDAQMLMGMMWLLAEHERAESPFVGVLDTAQIASVGHSNGGIACVLASSREPRITTTVVIAGGDPSIYKIKGPIFLIGSENDVLVDPATKLAPQFETAHAPAVFGIKKGAGHGEVMGAGGRKRGYITAWLAAQLKQDLAARAVFYAADCTICKDATWVIERKDIPGLPAPIPPTQAECTAKNSFPQGASQACKDCLCSTCPAQTVSCATACWSMAECMVETCRTTDLGSYTCATGQCAAQSAGYRGSAALSVHGYDCLSPGKCLEVCYP